MYSLHRPGSNDMHIIICLHESNGPWESKPFLLHPLHLSPIIQPYSLELFPSTAPSWWWTVWLSRIWASGYGLWVFNILSTAWSHLLISGRSKSMLVFHTFGSETSLWPGLSLGRSVSWSVSRSVCHNFIKDGRFHFHVPIGALVLLLLLP